MDKEFFALKEGKRDALTGLYSRDVIVDYVDKLISENKQFALVILDLDNFKYINDGYGHLFGDHVLVEYAKALEKVFKDRGVVGRYGGDEFIGVCEDVQEYNDIWQFLHDALALPKLLADKKLREMSITCTLGSSRFPLDATSLDGLFELADKALYRGKMKGRNCFIIYLHEKHANINLKTERDKVVSSMYLHSKVFNAVSRTKNIGSGLQEAMNFLGNYFMIDHLCLADDKNLYFEYIHPLCKKTDYIKVASKDIELLLNESIGIAYINSIAEDLRTNKTILKRILDDGIYSVFFCKIEVYGKHFGYVRADVCTNPRGRIWQNLDIDVLLNLAHVLALELYYQHLEIEDLLEE